RVILTQKHRVRTGCDRQWKPCCRVQLCARNRYTRALVPRPDKPIMTSSAPERTTCPIDLLVLPRWLLPLTESGPALLEQHGLALAGNRIVAVDHATQLQSLYPEARVLRLEHHVLLPGLVNAHGHSPLPLL